MSTCLPIDRHSSACSACIAFGVVRMQPSTPGCTVCTQQTSRGTSATGRLWRQPTDVNAGAAATTSEDVQYRTTTHLLQTLSEVERPVRDAALLRESLRIGRHAAAQRDHPDPRCLGEGGKVREALRALACQAESHRPRHLSGARCSWVELRLLEPRCVRSQRSSDRASPLRDRVPGHPARAQPRPAAP